MSAGHAYLFAQPNVVSEVATVDAIFTRSGNRILAVGFHVWLQRLVSGGRVRFDMREMAKEVREGRPALKDCMRVLVELGLVARVRFHGYGGAWVTDTVVFQRSCTEDELVRLAHAPSYRGSATIECYGNTYRCSDLRGTVRGPARNPVTPPTRNLAGRSTSANSASDQVAPPATSRAAGDLAAHKELRPIDLPSIDRSQATHVPQPSSEAQALIVDLDYGRHPLPSITDVDLLAGMVDTAIAEQGLTLPELRKHLQDALHRVRAPTEGGRAVPYLLGALQPERVPVSRARKRRPPERPPPELVAPAAPVDAPGDEQKMNRQEAMDFVRRHTKTSNLPLHRDDRLALRGDTRSADDAGKS